MKKLFSLILVLSLLCGGYANSKIIELKKCSIGGSKFNSDHYEKRGWVINTEKSLVQSVRVLTDNYYEEQKIKIIKEFGNLEGLNKISITNYEIEYLDKNYVRAVSKFFYNGEQVESLAEIDIKNKKIFIKFLGNEQVLCFA